MLLDKEPLQRSVNPRSRIVCPTPRPGSNTVNTSRDSLEGTGTV